MRRDLLQRLAVWMAIWIALCISIAWCTEDAHAADIDLQVHGLSYHLKRYSKDGEKFNQANGGLGLRWNASESLDVQAGFYRNSYGKESTYMIGDYLPIGNSIFRAGVFAGGVNHYPMGNGNVIAAGGLVLRAQWQRMNAILRFIPPVHPKLVGVFTLEFGWRL